MIVPVQLAKHTTIAKLPQGEQEELFEFSVQLQGLLASEKFEQKKAKIMLEVIRQQVKA